jgi:hypothetical protein
MPQAARVSGLLDKDFDDSWIVPARPRRRGQPSARARGGLVPASVAPLDSERARESRGTSDPVLAPESRLTTDPVLAPESCLTTDPVLAPEPVISAAREAGVAAAPFAATDPYGRRPDDRSAPSAGVPGRRTVTIRGQVARPSPRRPARTVHERTGTRPDRIAMWAVLLGILLVLVAATSSHAATLHALAGALH